MKRALILITLVTLMAATAIAQPAGPPPPPRHDVLADYLQLTDAQRSTLQSAHSDFEATARSLHDQERAIHDQIEQALSSATPDPTAIGKLVIQCKSIRDQIKAAHDALEAKLESVLTADQKAKYAAFEAAREFLQQQEHGPRR